MTHNESSPLLNTSNKLNYQGSDWRNNTEEAVIPVLPSSSSSSVLDNTTPVTFVNPNDELHEQRLQGSSLFVIFSGLFVAVALGSLDTSIVATIYPQIGTEFKRSNEIIWIATSYLLSYTALQPLYGRISDVFGRKSALLFATTLFLIGSILCGIANNLWSLVFARAIAGIGGGGINCLSTVITSDLIPLRERGKYQSYGNIAYAVGSVAGAPLGGFISDTLGWRYCFYLNIPFLLLTIFVASKSLTNYNLEEQNVTISESLEDKLKKIDYGGAITVIFAVVCFLVATSLGGNLRPWNDPIVLTCFACAFFFTVLFVIIEAKYAHYPLMPWSIISSQTPLACSLTNFFCVMSTTALVYITPLYFQALLGLSPSVSGLYFMPKIIAVSVGSVLAGIYMSKTGEYRNITIVISLLGIASMVGYTTWTPTTSRIFTSLCLAADGISLGVIITTTLIAMHSCVEHSEMATITSMSYLFRSVGGVVGISLSSAIFQAIVKSILVKKITGPNANLYIEIARTSMTEIRSLLPPDIIQVVLDSYEVALHYTYGTSAIVSCCTLVSALFIRSFKLGAKFNKKHT